MRIAVIPARGGSKRLPGKNIRVFHGQPIIVYSINTARRSGLFDRIYVSTESAEIARISKQAGAEILWRPEELADDVTGTPEVMRHSLTGGAKTDFACCIYPCAPLMAVEDLHTGLALLEIRPDAVFSFAMGTDPVRDAGQWYWGRAVAWRAGLALVEPHTIMVPIPVSRVQDINTEADWLAAEQKFAR